MGLDLGSDALLLVPYATKVIFRNFCHSDSKFLLFYLPSASFTTIGLPRAVHGSASPLQHAAVWKDGGMSPLYHHHLPIFLAMGPLGYRHLLALHHELGELVVLLHFALQEVVLQVGHTIPPARARQLCSHHHWLLRIWLDVFTGVDLLQETNL